MYFKVINHAFVLDMNQIKFVKTCSLDSIRLCVYNDLNITFGGLSMLDYISVQQVADKWGISERKIQKFCEKNRIDGALRFGHAWAIPKSTDKPVDARKKLKSDK